MLFNLIDKNCLKILLLFSMSPGRKRIRREIKEEGKFNNITLDYALNKLVFFKMLNEKKKIYSLELENSFIKEFIEKRKSLSNLPLNIQYMLLDFIDKISLFKKIKSIILFGSYSKLIFTDKSDLDIAIIFDDNIVNQTSLEKKIFQIKQDLSKKYSKEIECHYFLDSDMKHKEDPLIKDIIRNGIVFV